MEALWLLHSMLFTIYNLIINFLLIENCGTIVTVLVLCYC